MKFQDIKVGDVVAITKGDRWYSNVPKVRYGIHVVTKVTATQFSCGDFYRIRKSDGHMIGDTRHRRVEVATPELLQEHDKNVLEVEAYQKVAQRFGVFITALHDNKLTIQQKEAIASAYESTLTQE